VNEQVQRYGTALQLGDAVLMSIGLLGNDAPVHSLLEAPYLYAINYGPASSADAKRAHAALALVASDLSKRSRLTLLDRRIAHDLCTVVFPTALENLTFCTDWNLENKEAQALADSQHQTYPPCCEDKNRIEFGRRLSPFELNPFAAESEFIRACEEFCVNCVWNTNYASAIFGDGPRPPMAAVATDMITLVQFLGRMPREKPRTISECCREFLSSSRLYSIAEPVMDADAACRGFLWDMFMLIVCRQRNYHELEGWDHNRNRDFGLQVYAPFHQFHEPDRHVTDYCFPGGQGLGLPKSQTLSFTVSDMAGSLESLNADYIHSGPYRLCFTSQVSEHLTLGDDRQIRLYWDDPTLSRKLLEIAGPKSGRNILRTKPAIPGDSFNLYMTHVLGR
jgi:hypothetical protein